MPLLSALDWENPERYEWKNPLPHRMWQGVIILKSWYPVFWNGEKTGEVTVTKQGLYYAFSCVVHLPPGSHCRLYASTQGEIRDMGLCVPSGNAFVLQTRIPAKYFGGGEYSFCLNKPVTEEFVPVSSDKPFPALDRLESGKFAICGAEPGIVFPATEKPSHNP